MLISRLMKDTLIFAFIAVAASTTASAALGDKEASVETDRKAYSASRHSLVSRSKYTLHEISSDGLTVREYVNADGVVYAIAWNGIAHPDLTTLLGAYFNEYQAASRKAVKVRGRRPMSATQSENVTVEKSGHMRGIRGRAYVSSLVPEGVSIDEIQ